MALGRERRCRPQGWGARLGIGVFLRDGSPRKALSRVGGSGETAGQVMGAADRRYLPWESRQHRRGREVAGRR